MALETLQWNNQNETCLPFFNIPLERTVWWEQMLGLNFQSFACLFKHPFELEVKMESRRDGGTKGHEVKFYPLPSFWTSWHHPSTRFKNHWSMLTSQSCGRQFVIYALSSCKADRHQNIKTPLLIFSTKPTPHIAKSLQEPLQFPQKLEIMIIRFFSNNRKR